MTDELYSMMWKIRQAKMCLRLDGYGPAAVLTENGGISYLCADPGTGAMYGLLAFYTREALAAYMEIKGIDRTDFNRDPNRLSELRARVEGMDLTYGPKSEAEDEEAATFSAWAKKSGIRLRGANCFPVLGRYRRGYAEVYAGPEDLPRMTGIVRTAAAICEELEKKTPEELGFIRASGKTLMQITEVPSFSLREDGTLVTGRLTLESFAEPHLEPACGENEFQRTRVKRMKKTSIWQCRLIRLMKRMEWTDQESGEKELVLPEQLLAVRQSDSHLVDIQPVALFEQRGSVMLNVIMSAIMKEEDCPRLIRTDDEETYRYLKDWCERAGIQIRMSGERLSVLDEMSIDLAGEGTEEEPAAGPDGSLPGMSDSEREELLHQFREIVTMFRLMNDDEVRKIPEAERMQLAFSCAMCGLLGADEKLQAACRQLGERLLDVDDDPKGGGDGKTSCGRSGKAGGQQGGVHKIPVSDDLLRNTLSIPVTESVRRSGGEPSGRKKHRRSRKKAKTSYVISCSLGTGVYRHIQIDADQTLEQLHSAIIDSFDFFDDHAHIFFMDNIYWSEEDSYTSAEAAEPYDETTDEYRLDEVITGPGMKFKYIFDFGYEWRVQCRVLKVLDETVGGHVVVRSKGESPDQYPDFEDWDDEDDDDDGQ